MKLLITCIILLFAALTALIVGAIQCEDRIKTLMADNAELQQSADLWRNEAAFQLTRSSENRLMVPRALNRCLWKRTGDDNGVAQVWVAELDQIGIGIEWNEQTETFK